MTNRQIANSFKLLADLMELHRENPFKIRSYRTAYQNIRRLPQALEKTTDAELLKISGIGKAIAAKITEMLKTGTMSKLIELQAKTPQGVQELLKVRGLGPKKISTLWQALGIQSPAELLYACRENRLVRLKGFGEKSQQDIASKLEYHIQSKGSHLYRQIDLILPELIQKIATLKLQQGSFVSDVALQRNTIQHLEYLYSGEPIRPDALIQLGFEDISTLNDSEHDLKAMYLSNYRVHFVHVDANIYPYQYLQKCCSPAFSKHFFNKLTEHNTADIELLEKQFGVAHIPIPSREIVPKTPFDYKQLVKEEDIKGVIHCHSTYSDGANSLKDMAQACIDSGYEYLVISDHSKAAFYANGLTERRVLEQWDEIDKLNAEYKGFRIIKGIEVDILSDGSLDYSDTLLSGFELVIASVHSQLKMNESKATNRLIKAIENPHTDVLGHLTSRLLLARKGYPVNHIRIIEACAANNVAIELNANPFRLDIDWSWIPIAQEKGVKISVNPDAHSIDEIKNIKYGIIAARKGLLLKGHCLNSLQADSLLEHLSANSV